MTKLDACHDKYLRFCPGKMPICRFKKSCTLPCNLQGKKHSYPVGALHTFMKIWSLDFQNAEDGVCPGKHENRNAHSLRRHYPDQVQRDFLSPYHNNPGQGPFRLLRIQAPLVLLSSLTIP